MLATSLSSLYEKDYVEWLDITLAQLQNHDLVDLDWTHLIEEVEALGSEQRHKVESYTSNVHNLRFVKALKS